MKQMSPAQTTRDEAAVVDATTAAGYTFTAVAEPFACEIAQDGAAPIWRLTDLRWRDEHGRWQRPAAWQVVEQGPDGALRQAQDGALRHAQDDGFTLHGIGADGALAVILRGLADGPDFRLEIETTATVVDATTAASWLAADLDARPDEHFLGLGERFDRVDQRGQVVDLQVVNGASGGLTYKPVPFYISSAGYGLLIDTGARTILRLATPDDPAVVSIRCNAAAVSLRVIAGATPAEILARYTALAGRPSRPPMWVFGPWKSRDWMQETEATAREDADEGRRHGLAGTVKLIDAAWQAYYQSFTFHPERFPHPAEMIRHIRSQGYRLVLWVAPWIVKDAEPSETYQECARRGLFIRRPDGQPYVHRLANSPTFVGSCLDFTNPETVAWWQAHIRRLAQMGVDGFKTDFGEQIPEDAVVNATVVASTVVASTVVASTVVASTVVASTTFADGRTGRELHNIYPRLYNQATAEALAQETTPDRSGGILLARSAWHGSQPFSAFFAGDQSSDFGPATGLPSVIVAGQNAGLSGFPFWACDIGGYFGVPTDEVFVRWAQFGAFCPIMQIHGTGCREPWRFSPATLATYRRYAQLRMDLLPYVYTLAQQAVETGLPLLRALPLAFPDDPGVWDDVAAHEYCFGAQLLVAPVYYGLDRFRHLYLPAGGWRDFWTGEWRAGGRTHRIPADLETIPVHARAGAIIPWLDPSADTCVPAEDMAIRQAGNDLRLALYPGADGCFTLYDGTRFTWHEQAAALLIEGSPIERQVSARLVGRQGVVRQVRDADGAPVAWTTADLAGQPVDARITAGAGGSYRIQWEWT
jgi:alpha-D-xyloside xylohydrolase